MATVSLNRPPVNAVTRQMQLELREAFDSLSEDRQVGAVVLAAEGERAFCGGIDLKETAAQQQRGAQQQQRGGGGGLSKAVLKRVELRSHLSEEYQKDKHAYKKRSMTIEDIGQKLNKTIIS